MEGVQLAQTCPLSAFGRHLSLSGVAHFRLPHEAKAGTDPTNMIDELVLRLQGHRGQTCATSDFPGQAEKEVPY